MKRKYTFNAFVFAVMLLVTGVSCNKSMDTPAEMESRKAKSNTPQTVNTTVKFLGHKGAGSNNYNDVNMEQSIASFTEALNVLDGVEVDMQMSLDGTIWLFHDIDINHSLCTPGAPRSILTMHDNEIAQLRLCSHTKKDRVYKLSELIDLWNSYPKGFYISMEIKEDFETATYDAVGGRPAYLGRFAKSLAESLMVLKHSPQQFLIEEDDRVFPDAFTKYPVGKEVAYYVFEYKPFDSVVADALAMGFDGVSCNFTDKTITAAKIKAAQNKGLKVQLWTPYYDSEVLKVYNMHPDFIQTDHTNVKSDLGIK